MYEIEDVMRATGYTRDQAYDRIGRLSSTLGNGVQRGQNHRLLVTDELLAGLRRMSELERDRGLSAKQAEAEVLSEMESAEEPEHNGHNDAETLPEGWRKYVELLEAELRQRDQRIAYLEDENRELRQLALPAPRRGMFAQLGDLFRSSGPN